MKLVTVGSGRLSVCSRPSFWSAVGTEGGTRCWLCFCPVLWGLPGTCLLGHGGWSKALAMLLPCSPRTAWHLPASVILYVCSSAFQACLRRHLVLPTRFRIWLSGPTSPSLPSTRLLHSQHARRGVLPAFHPRRVIPGLKRPHKPAAQMDASVNPLFLQVSNFPSIPTNTCILQ